MARVLVVEDNAINLILAREILELRGHEVLAAGSVGEALTRLLESVPDIVLLDVHLPGGGGEALLKEIRRNPALAKLPVIAVTALAMRGDRERLLAAGFDGYLSKPIDTVSFGPTIESYLSD